MAFIDNFNRANENLDASANWSVVTGASGAAVVSSNQLAGNTTQSSGLIVCPDQGSADHYVEYTLQNAFTHSYVVCRATDGDNWIGVRGWDNKLQLRKKVAGTVTTLSEPFGIANGDTIRLECSSDSLKVFRNSTEVISVTDSFNNTETRQGVVPITSSPDPWIDNFEAGALAAAGPAITSMTDPVTTNTSATIVCTGAEATQGTGGVTQGGVAVTETAWSDTSVTFDSVDIETSSLKYGNQTFVLTANGGGSDSIVAAVQPATNRAYVDIGTPATAGDRITATPVDLATNDQVAYDTRLFASDGVTPTAYTVSIDSTGVFTLGGGPIPDGTYYIKDIRVYDNSDSSWGTLADQTVTISSGQIMTPPTTIYVNMSNTGVDLPNVPVPWSYNNYIATKGTSVQQITADLKNSNNESTNITLDTVNPITGAIGSAGNADGSIRDWPEEVFEYAWYAGATESPAKLRLGGLQDGDRFRIEIAGHQGTQPTRDTDFTVGGQSGRYDNSGTVTPNEPLVLEGTVSGTTLDIDAALVDSFAYFTGFKLEINAGPTSGNRDSVFKIGNYLLSTGNYTSTQCNDVVKEWLLSTGQTYGTINEMLYRYLGGLGYTGTLQDRMKAWNDAS